MPDPKACYLHRQILLAFRNKSSIRVTVEQSPVQVGSQRAHAYTQVSEPARGVDRLGSPPRPPLVSLTSSSSPRKLSPETYSRASGGKRRLQEIACPIAKNIIFCIHVIIADAVASRLLRMHSAELAKLEYETPSNFMHNIRRTRTREILSPVALTRTPQLFVQPQTGVVVVEPLEPPHQSFPYPLCRLLGAASNAVRGCLDLKQSDEGLKREESSCVCRCILKDQRGSISICSLPKKLEPDLFVSHLPSLFSLTR